MNSKISKEDNKKLFKIALIYWLLPTLLIMFFEVIVLNILIFSVISYTVGLAIFEFKASHTLW